MRRVSSPSVCLLLLIHSAVSGRAAEDISTLPQPVEANHFAALQESSPFLRMLSLQDAFALSGVAVIEGNPLVILQNRETKKTINVSGGKENELGMRLVTVTGEDPESVAVTIAHGGSEHEFAYEDAVIRPNGLASSRGRQGTRDTVRRDREGRVVTSEELVKKWQSLSDDQRRAYDRWKDQLLKTRPDLRYSEKRFPIAHKALDAFKAGKTPPPSR